MLGLLLLLRCPFTQLLTHLFPITVDQAVTYILSQPDAN